MIDVAPPLIIEVSSPSTRQYDQTLKRTVYQKLRGSEYWFVDVPSSSIWIYRRREPDAEFDEPLVLHDATDVLRTPVIPGLEVRMADIFDVRPPT